MSLSTQNSLLLEQINDLEAEVENLNETSRIFSLLDPQNVYANEGRGLLTDNAISTLSNNVFFGFLAKIK